MRKDYRQWLARAVDNIRTKNDIERTMIDLLRRLGMLPPAPARPKPSPPLRLVKKE
jgi:hypothetical protein